MLNIKITNVEDGNVIIDETAELVSAITITEHDGRAALGFHQYGEMYVETVLQGLAKHVLEICFSSGKKEEINSLVIAFMDIFGDEIKNKLAEEFTQDVEGGVQ